jgi:hypothetical protein
MSDYCGWCSKKLSIREQNDMPPMERDSVKSVVKMNYPLCYNCREIAKKDGWKRKDD